LSLTLWIVLGFVFGILLGLILGDLCSVLAPISEIFIKIWQITILPSVVLSLIVGIGSLKKDAAKNIAAKAGQVLLLFWLVGIWAYFSMQLAFPTIEKAFFFSTQSLVETEDFSVVDLFIPSNPFRSLSDGVLPAIVVFCLCLGFALMMDEKSKSTVASLNIFLSALTRITGYLAKTFPIGVFIITAQTFGSMSFETFLELQVFLVTLAALSILLGLVVLPLMITCITSFSYREIVSAASKAMILGFSTGSEFVTLPLIVESVIGLFSKENGNGKVNEEIRSYCEVLVPIAYTFPLLGAFAPFLFMLFVSWLYKSPMDIADQIRLIIVGIPSFFGSSKVSVISLLSLMHFPADSYNIYISSGILRQCFIASLSTISIFSFSTISIALLTNRHRLEWKRVIFSSLFIILLALLMIGGLQMVFSHLLANTYHGSDLISNISLPLDSDGKRANDDISSKVYLSMKDVRPFDRPSSVNMDSIRQIKKRGFLRVGYNSNCIPFVFFNGKGELVGYDVQMAYDLADFIKVSQIEFVPITGDTIASSLNQNLCDIVMSSIMVTSERLDEMIFTDAYISVHMAFVVLDEQKKDFLKQENVQKMRHLKIAVLNNTALIDFAPELFPQAEIVRIDGIEDFFAGGDADALFTTAEEGYTMTLQHPFYDVAIFEPNDAFQVMYAYPIAENSSDTYLMLLNYWIKMEHDYGRLEKKYDYWILGKNIAQSGPRWSVVRNVLHWVN
jgi:proton glutamate symport protein